MAPFLQKHGDSGENRHFRVPAVVTGMCLEGMGVLSGDLRAFGDTFLSGFFSSPALSLHRIFEG